jgi:hypothetical protein
MLVAAKKLSFQDDDASRWREWPNVHVSGRTKPLYFGKATIKERI